MLAGCKSEHPFIKKVSFKDARNIQVIFAGPVDIQWAQNLSNFTLYEEPDPDILIPIKKTTLSPDGTNLIIEVAEDLNRDQPHILTLKDVVSEGRPIGTIIVGVKKLYLGILFSILMGAMVINNFVFTKYLGLCVFFGTSRRRSTAIGMGITFTIVIVVASMMSWFMYQFILKPFNLDFLQIIVFIGLVSLSVQAVDTILRKVNPMLFKAFGVYLVLVIANCIILAVPLILADNEYDAFESFFLALGAGLGFLIALFLMASVRERLELANVPPTFRGLPIAFVVAGLFALAFMGFSGMSIF
jgi:electron transport complex protein RnfA